MLPFHPYADLFPLIEGEAFAELVADIKANDVREKIVVWDGAILDGRNRYLAALEAGLIDDDDGPDRAKYFTRFVPSVDGNPLAFVMSKNLQRRHLDESQRAMVAERLANMPQGRPAADGKPANLPVKQADAAKMLSISERAVRSARAVQQRGVPELGRAVDRGRLAVSAAAQASKLAPEIQRKIAAEAEAGRANVVRSTIKKEARGVREKELGDKIRALPDEKFGFILADPEWHFTPYSEATGSDRSASNHYPTSPDATIEARGVADIAAPDSVCGLWVTDLARGIDTLRAWGFTFKSYFVWVKDVVDLPLSDIERRALDAGDYAERSINVGNRRVLIVSGPQGTGYWNTDRDELFLIGTRGNPVCPAPGEQGESVWFAARGEHSKAKGDAHSDKPEISYRWIEKHFANTPKIELNARRARPGWKVWGNEAPEESTTPVAEDPPAKPPAESSHLLPKSESPKPQTLKRGGMAEDPNLSDVFEIPDFLRRDSQNRVPVASVASLRSAPSADAGESG